MSGSVKLALPEYFALKSKSNGKYLRYVHDDDKARGLLEFSGDQIVSPYVKFHARAVPHKQGEGGSRTTMYHLRCCYNNKYWRRVSQTGSLIAGGADAPEEDSSKWACTLFKAEFDGRGIVRLLHGQSDSYLSQGSEPGHQSRPDCLVARSGDEGDVFEVVDYSESVVVLPKLVAFKGDNGQYVKHASIHVHISRAAEVALDIFPLPFFLPRPKLSYWMDGLQFSVDKIEDPWAAHEVFTNPLDATIRIKSVKEGKFWRRVDAKGGTGHWIQCDSSDTTFDDKDTVFQVVKVPSKDPQDVKIALKNCGNGLFCRLFYHSDTGSCLIADAEHIDEASSPLLVEEPVKERRIFDVDIRSNDARTINMWTIKDSDWESIPNSTSTARKVTMKIALTKTTSTSWSTTTTWKIGGKLQLDFKFPGLDKVLPGAKVELSGEYSKGDMVGGSKSTSSTKETTQDFTVPPMKRVRLSLEETTTIREIPFSYSYTDKLYNDQEAVTYRVEDGLLTSTTIKEVITPIEEPL